MVLDNELPEDSDQFRFLRSSCFTNLKGVVGLIMEKVSAIRISIPLDLSSWSFIPFPRFIRSCRHTDCGSFPNTFFLRVLSKWHMLSVFILVFPQVGFCDRHSSSVIFSFPWPSTFFDSAENKHTISHLRLLPRQLSEGTRDNKIKHLTPSKTYGLNSNYRRRSRMSSCRPVTRRGPLSLRFGDTSMPSVHDRPMVSHVTGPFPVSPVPVLAGEVAHRYRI